MILNRRKEACHCKNVTYGMIEDAIRNGADTLQQVIDMTGVGKGCGKCKEFLEYLGCVSKVESMTVSK